MRVILAISASALLAAMFCLAAVVHGQSLTPAQRKQADRNFAEGRKLFEQEKWDEALSSFEAANEIAPHPVVLANIGLCHERAGRLMRALEIYREFIADPQVTEDKADEIWIRIDGIEARLGRINVTCPIPDCDVVVVAKNHGPAPLVVLVEPGSHKVECYHLSESLEPEIVEVASGEVVNVSIREAVVEPEPEPEPEPAPEPEPEGGGITLGLPFWIATGVTVAGGVGIIAFGARTLKLKGDYEDSDRLDAGIREDGERSRLVTNVMIGITGAAAATAAGFLIHSMVVGSREEAVARTRLTPVLGSGFGLSLTRDF